MNTINSKTVRKLLTKSEKYYSEINFFTSKGRHPLLDYAYPKHDGKQNPNNTAILYELRERINAIRTICEMITKDITDVID